MNRQIPLEMLLWSKQLNHDSNLNSKQCMTKYVKNLYFIDLRAVQLDEKTGYLSSLKSNV